MFHIDMLVLKFGGTSVGSPEAIENIIAIAQDPKHALKVRVIVVSAFSGVTDALIALAHKALRAEEGFNEALNAVLKRHIDCAAHFLNGEALGAAKAEIEDHITELKRVLEGAFFLKELSVRTLDYVMSFGERLSASLIARIFCAAGIKAEYLDSRLVIKTDGDFGKAKVLRRETDSAVRSYFEKHPLLQIAAGFIGSVQAGEAAAHAGFEKQPLLQGGAPDGAATTLGRGGSDLSAAIYAAALGASTIEIWTDVDGILTSDPKLVKNAQTIPAVTFTEAMELSHFGAKVLHPPTVLPALEKNIPIKILNTFNRENPGTLIDADGNQDGAAVKGISLLKNITLLRVQGPGLAGERGFAARLFGSLSACNINIILITQASSEYSICFAVRPEDGQRAASAIKNEFERELSSSLLEEPIVEEGRAIIAVVGSKMKHATGISGTIFEALGICGVNVIAIAQGSSETNISFVVGAEDTEKALNSVHNAFFKRAERLVKLFLVGTGRIGGTLLSQIGENRVNLQEKYGINIKIAGLASSRKMVFFEDGAKSFETFENESGSFLQMAKKALEGPEASELDFKAFLSKVKLEAGALFCDCTASPDVAALYGGLLKSGVPVVTPNKKAVSADFGYYSELKALSDGGIPFDYEVTVCAGLPVLSTLRELQSSGDRILRIEAVVSGTLSFIFNNFDGSSAFSALVRKAHEAGYTEPDPRDDLNAFDAARKALILARECGAKLEFDDVEIEPILPASCFEAPSIDEFWKELEKADAAFEARRKAAAKEGRALRYVAVVENGSAKLRLRAEPEDSQFRRLCGAENIVVITSERYNKLPLVVRGPGAGLEVTAGGVFACILRSVK